MAATFLSSSGNPQGQLGNFALKGNGRFRRSPFDGHDRPPPRVMRGYEITVPAYNFKYIEESSPRR